jgi:hypothetical protein
MLARAIIKIGRTTCFLISTIPPETPQSFLRLNLLPEKYNMNLRSISNSSKNIPVRSKDNYFAFE